MGKPSDHPEFDLLSALWEKKLFDSGFNDIEVNCGGHKFLKVSGTLRRIQKMDAVTRQIVFEYFNEVSRRVAQTHFHKELDRQIMTLYSQGYSQASIQKILGIQGHRSKIYGPLYRWLKHWGLK